MAHDEFADFTADVQAMQWEHVALAPDPAEVAAIDQELPQDWLQSLEDQELDPFEDLYTMSDEDLRAEVSDSVQALDLDIQAAIDEIKGPDMNLDITLPDHDFDFGR
jgi:hypothetical protein